MKTISGALLAYLNSNQEFLMTDLYTITLVGGFVQRISAGDVAVTYGGNVFSSTNAAINRSGLRNSIGLEVDTLHLDIYVNDSILLNGVPWTKAARLGLLDGATIQLERLFQPTWGDVSLGTMLLFRGNVSDIEEIGLRTISLSVKSELEKLNVMMPRNLFQPGCTHTLYDAGCTITKASQETNRTVASGATTTVIPLTSSADAAGKFALGDVFFNVGSNAGVTRTIKSHTAGVIILATPLAIAPSSGETIKLYSGCDKTPTTCNSKFANKLNFGGTPYIPEPESALGEK